LCENADVRKTDGRIISPVANFVSVLDFGKVASFVPYQPAGLKVLDHAAVAMRASQRERLRALRAKRAAK
jgi:hypothetical protein